MVDEPLFLEMTGRLEVSLGFIIMYHRQIELNIPRIVEFHGYPVSRVLIHIG